MRLLLFFILILNIHVYAYDMGRGVSVNEKLHLGGYFSTDYTVSKNQKLLRLDDVAVMAYGNLNDKLSYMLELEAAPVYTYDFKSDAEHNSFHFHRERIYLDYKYSDNANFRLGKQITPIGYWNLEPINVLRDTSSNPLLSTQMFPKFLSGLNMYGYLPGFESVRYHVFAQHNKDLDEEYINIINDHFFGASIEYETDYDVKYGGSLGQFITKTNDRSRFVQLNIKYETYPFTIQSEGIFSKIENNNTHKTNDKFAGYIQSIYSIDTKNSLIGRYEYFKDNVLDNKQNIGVVGYSYRPIYSVSFKSEYQLNSDSNLNKFIISFSVLF